MVGGIFLLFDFYARFNVMNDFANESRTSLIKFDEIFYPVLLIDLIKLGISDLYSMWHDVVNDKMKKTALPFRLQN